MTPETFNARTLPVALHKPDGIPLSSSHRRSRPNIEPLTISKAVNMVRILWLHRELPSHPQQATSSRYSYGMFLATTDGDAAAINRMHTRFSMINRCGPVHYHNMNNIRVAWFRHRFNDALHIYNDGIVIGERNSVGEAGPDGPIMHDENMPKVTPPLINAVTISDTGEVTPANITNIYNSNRAVSDFQILLALHTNAEIDPVDVAIFTAVRHLPGNETLFKEIKRIPLWHTGFVGSNAIRLGPLPDDLGGTDEALIDRLTAITPHNPNSAIAMSGGIDSRFILGVLLRSGIRPHVYSRYGGEDITLAESIANQLSLQFTPMMESTDEVADEDYSLLTDGQIYFRGGRFSRFRGYIPDGTILHTGLCAESVIKSANKSVWKKPGRSIHMFDRLISQLIGVSMPRGLRSNLSVGELGEILRERLQYQREILPVERSSQIANSFHYMNKSVRWAQAHVSDASTMRPLALLSDSAVFRCSLATGAWPNFANHRARELNRSLLPNLDVPYESGLSSVPSKGLSGVAEKLRYEFIDRFRVRQSALAHPFKVATPQRSYEAADAYFTDPLASSHTTRAASTIADVVEFLDANRG